MTAKTIVVGNEYCGYYNGLKDGNSCSGSTSTVTLQRGSEYARCEDILIWEEEHAAMCFDEWKEFALAGEEGYTYWQE
jgi:hypothetical protein